MGGYGVPLNCNVTFPYTLAAGGQLTCTYETALQDDVARVNIGTATIQNFRYAVNDNKEVEKTADGTKDFSGEVKINFGTATITEIDKCVLVSDSLVGPLGRVCTYDSILPKIFNYSYTMGPYTTCGSKAVPNTANISGEDADNTNTNKSVSTSVAVNVPCQSGCTLTIGYWKTHAGFGPQSDMVTKLLPQILGLSGNPKTINVTLIKQAVNLLSFYGSDNAFNASNGINKLYAQLLAAKLNNQSGANSTAIAAIIKAADTFLANNNSASWSSKTFTAANKNTVLSWVTTLDDFNNGLVGPGHCSQ
jgi:hypothetical protein